MASRWKSGLAHERDRGRAHPYRARDRVGTDEDGLQQADACEDQAARRS